MFAFLLPWISLSCEAGGLDFHDFVRFITGLHLVNCVVEKSIKSFENPSVSEVDFS